MLPNSFLPQNELELAPQLSENQLFPFFIFDCSFTSFSYSQENDRIARRLRLLGVHLVSCENLISLAIILSYFSALLMGILAIVVIIEARLLFTATILSMFLIIIVGSTYTLSFNHGLKNGATILLSLFLAGTFYTLCLFLAVILTGDFTLDKMVAILGFEALLSLFASKVAIKQWTKNSRLALILRLV